MIKWDEVTVEDYNTWKHLDVTKAYMAELDKAREEIKGDLGNGMALGDNTLERHALAVGVCRGLNFATELQRESNQHGQEPVVLDEEV